VLKSIPRQLLALYRYERAREQRGAYAAQTYRANALHVLREAKRPECFCVCHSLLSETTASLEIGVLSLHRTTVGAARLHTASPLEITGLLLAPSSSRPYSKSGALTSTAGRRPLGLPKAPASKPAYRARNGLVLVPALGMRPGAAAEYTHRLVFVADTTDVLERPCKRARPPPPTEAKRRDRLSVVVAKLAASR